MTVADERKEGNRGVRKREERGWEGEGGEERSSEGKNLRSGFIEFEVPDMLVVMGLEFRRGGNWAQI